MNTVKLNKMLDAYYKDFEKNWKDEEYKWIEVKLFQDKYNSNCKAEDFVDMLKTAIVESSNLVASHHYYAFADLLSLASKLPVETQQALNRLFDEDIDVDERIKEYSHQIDILKEKANEDNTAYAKDRRFISTMLFFKYPWKYTIYKYTENRDFALMYELGIDIIKGSEDYIHKAKDLVEVVAAYLQEHRKDIIKLYKEKLKTANYYQDENLLLLAQNIIWYATTCDYGQIPVEPVKDIHFEHGQAKLSKYKPAVSTEGKKSDYIKLAKEKAKVGIIGENFVIEFENKRLKDAGLNKVALWEAKNKGDGLGYDILSYNDDGTERYIEVKTTTSSENTMFFITATELEACKKYGEDYYIYRVYKEDDEYKISWYQGKEVEALCNCPYTYAVIPE